jgi:MFS family permease
MLRHPDQRSADRVLSRRQVTSWRNSMFLIFGLSGLGLASWVTRIPAVRDALGSSTLEMGLLLFGVAVGSIAGLLASGHLIARLGARKALVACLTVGPTGLIVAGFGGGAANSFGVVFAGLMIFGVSAAVSGVAINVSGAANERALGRTIMPIFHACFSGGTMIGAGLGALAELLNISVVLHIGVIAVTMFAVGQLALRHVQHELILSADDDAGVRINKMAATELANGELSNDWRSRLSLWREPRVLMIGVIVLGMAFAEGSANDWLALAAVDGYGVANEVGALMFGLFVTAMTVGRLLGGFLLDRFGRVPVLRGSAVLAVVGLSLVIFGGSIGVAVAGTVLWGLGSALGFPVVMSAAADDPRNAAARVSIVATIGYAAGLIGPPLIGGLGQQFGLLNALLVVLGLLAAAGVCSGAARKQGLATPVA